MGTNKQHMLPRSPMTRVVCVVTAAVKNRFRRKARPPNRGGFEVLEVPRRANDGLGHSAFGKEIGSILVKHLPAWTALCGSAER